MEKLNLMTQKEMNDTFIAAFEGIKGVCEKITTGNVSHNVATIRCKCVEMLQFFEDWNKHIPSATDEVLSRVPELQWKKHEFGLLASTELCSYNIEELQCGEIYVYTLFTDDFEESAATVEEAKQRANKNYKEKIRKLLGV